MLGQDPEDHYPGQGEGEGDQKLESGVCSAPGTGRDETSELQEPAPSRVTAPSRVMVPRQSPGEPVRSVRFSFQPQDEESSREDEPSHSVDLGVKDGCSTERMSPLSSVGQRGREGHKETSGEGLGWHVSHPCIS